MGFGPICMGVSVGHLPSDDHVQRLPYVGSSQNALSLSLYERHPPGTSTIISSHFEGLPTIEASRKSTRSSGGRHVAAAFGPIARGLGHSPTYDQEQRLPLVGSSQNRLSFTLYVRHPPSTPACRSSHCFGLDLTYLDGSASRTSMRASGGTHGANVSGGPASQHSQSAERPARMRDRQILRLRFAARRAGGDFSLPEGWPGDDTDPTRGPAPAARRPCVTAKSPEPAHNNRMSRGTRPDGRRSRWAQR